MLQRNDKGRRGLSIEVKGAVYIFRAVKLLLSFFCELTSNLAKEVVKYSYADITICISLS